jgi:hypothetical protein
VTLSRFSRRDHREAPDWAKDHADRNVVSLLTEVVMLPFTALLYGMELIVRAMQGVQHATQEGVDVMAGGSAPSAPLPVRASVSGEPRDEVVSTTSGISGGPEQKPAHKEAAAMSDQSICHESKRDRDLRDDMLKLVRYKILFVRREYEAAFPEQEDLIEDNMDSTSFAAWKVAEFIQELHRGDTAVPRRWRDRKYPGDAHTNAKGNLTSLPEQDKKYLRVYYEVLDRYPREKFKHEEQQIRVLEEIRDSLKP